jgi:hypothetical protein
MYHYAGPSLYFSRHSGFLHFVCIGFLVKNHLKRVLKLVPGPPEPNHSWEQRWDSSSLWAGGSLCHLRWVPLRFMRTFYKTWIHLCKGEAPIFRETTLFFLFLYIRWDLCFPLKHDIDHVFRNSEFSVCFKIFILNQREELFPYVTWGLICYLPLGSNPVEIDWIWQVK